MARRLAAVSKLRLRATFEWRVSGERAHILPLSYRLFPAPKTTLGLIETKHAIIPGGGKRGERLLQAFARLQAAPSASRVSSARVAPELIFTAAIFDAAYAHSVGIVGNAVDDAFGRATEIARKILKMKAEL